MQRFGKQFGIGLRWMKCGSRLFMRNPWLLGGMGVSMAALIGVLSLIPLLGDLIISLLAPILLASTYIATDKVSRQKMALPKTLRGPAMKQSPLELIAVFRHESHIMPMAVASIYCAAVVLLVNALAQSVLGDAWVSRPTSLGTLTQIGVVVVALMVLLVYFVLAASLIYALPLAFLRDEALVPAIRRSFSTTMDHLFAVLAILALLLVPPILAGIVSQASAWMAFFVQFVVSSFIFPLVATSLYCSYRTIFPGDEAGTGASLHHGPRLDPVGKASRKYK